MATQCVALAFVAQALRLPDPAPPLRSQCTFPAMPFRKFAVSMSVFGGTSQKEWWEQRGELPFDCTGCGKCCKVSGDVWCTPKEAEGLADHLHISLADFTQQYGKLEVEGWVQLKSRQGLDGKDDGCIFLDQNNACTVYPARPIQCSTYPFFPRFLRTPESWNSEVVLPGEEPDTDDGRQDSKNRYWSAESGGCEGMREITDVRFNQKKKEWKVAMSEMEQGRNDTVSADEVMFKLKMYERNFLTFPHEALLKKELELQASQWGLESSSSAILRGLDSRIGTQLPSQAPPPQFYDQIFAAASMVDRELASMRRDQELQIADANEAGADSGAEGDMDVVLSATMRWAEEHVVRLGLCPHAKAVLQSGRMRTLVRPDITDEEDAWGLFLSEADRLMANHEDDLPTTLLVLPNLYTNEFEGWNDFTSRLEDQLDEGGALEHVGDHVLIAAFHPTFEFAGLAGEEQVLSYEKRAPYPILNLLRTEAIDRGIEQGITAQTIADHNEKALLEEGLAEVERAFRELTDT